VFSYAGLNPGGVERSVTPSLWMDASAGLPKQAPIWTMADLGRRVLVGTSGPAAMFRSETLSTHWLPSDAGLPRGSSAVAFGVGVDRVLAGVLLP